MNVRVYEYAKCSTCRKALSFLDSKKVAYAKIPIVEQPPTVAELGAMLKILGGDLKRMFNTSGELYREMGVAEKLKTMSTDAAIKLLAKNGKLVKRPFVLAGERGLVGFKEEEWKVVFK
jgi:Spx/MgsR family transcriptional regulator